jgi:HK97 family phage prohead protease
MPWHVEKGGGTCAVGEWAVLKNSDGSTAGCHPTQAKAEAQMAALYANENDQRPRGGEFRSFRFELGRAEGRDDGLTFEGYAAVFNQPARIQDWDGEFDEVIKRGAFARTLASRTPKLMFEHGRHPLVGQMPLGVISDAREDAKGLFVRARLSDNWLIQPVRDAVRDGAVDGMSFRFSVPEGGDQWKDRKGDVPLRSLTDVDVPEVGPVVFPAYEPTTASVRSLVERLEDFTAAAGAERTSGGEHGADPGKGGVPAEQQALLLARDRAWQLRRRLHA